MSKRHHLLRQGGEGRAIDKPLHCYRSYGVNDYTCQKPYGHSGKCGPLKKKTRVVKGAGKR